MSTLPPQQIEKVERLSAIQFRKRYVQAGHPVVLTGLASDWKAYSAWSLDYFQSRYGDHSIVVERTRLARPSTIPCEYLQNRYFEKEHLGEVITRMQSGDHPPGSFYITYSNILERAPDLSGDIQPLHRTLGLPEIYPDFLKSALSLRPGLWLGPAETVTPLHFDRQENLNVQISGRKRWTLFAPECARILYADAAELPTPIFSPIDIEAPDLERYPMFARAQPLQTLLEAGDVLYIPTGWWHHVRTLETSISLNFWWWSLPSVKTTARLNYRAVRLAMIQRLRGQKKTTSAMPLD